MGTPPDPGTENGVFVTYRGMAMVTVYPAPGSKIHTRRVLGSDGYWYFIPPDAEVELDVAPVRTYRPGEHPTKPNTSKVMWKDNRFVRIEDVSLEEWD